MPRNECRACGREFFKSMYFLEHKHLCMPNRNAYLKILALNLDPKDTKLQENLKIRYEYVPDPESLTEYEQGRVQDMKRHLTMWGDAPPTAGFVKHLGVWTDEEIERALNFKRKRTPAEDDLAISNLAPLPNPNASTTSHRTYHAPSPPPLEDLLASPSFANTVSYSHPPALNTHPRPQASRQETSDTVIHNIIQQSPKNEDSEYLGDFVSSFDLAFAKWLDEENISKAAIGRLLKDPAMQPITSKLSWKSVSKMKDRLASIEVNENDD